jgi:dCTP deaminase
MIQRREIGSAILARLWGAASAVSSLWTPQGAILSNRKIWEAMDDGRIVISPAPDRYTRKHDPKGRFGTDSIDFRLDSKLIHVPKGGEIDPQKEHLAKLIATWEQTNLGEGGKYPLAPGEFILGQTLERLTLPSMRTSAMKARPLLSAKVDGVSRLGRLGLMIHSTASTIHCGTDNHIALEIKNISDRTIVLTQGMNICQFLFLTVFGDPVHDDGFAFACDQHVNGRKQAA